MPRIPLSGKVFVDQVTALRKSAKATWSDEDGLGVYRVLSFDKATSKWLWPLMEQLDDGRIAGAGYQKEIVTVVFSHRSLADRKDEFPLEAAQAVAEDQQRA